MGLTVWLAVSRAGVLVDMCAGSVIWIRESFVGVQ